MGPGTRSVEGVVAGFSRADMAWGGLRTRPIFLRGAESVELA
jgi:hypothetical protein